SFGRGWKQHFIIAYQGKRSSGVQQKAALDEYCKQIRVMLRDLDNPFALTMIEDHKRLKQFADEYARARAAFNNYKAGRLKLDELKSRYPMLHRALKAIHDFRNRNLIIRKEFSSTVRTLDYDKLMLSLESLPSDELLELFEIDASAIKEATVDKKTIEKAERRWSNREATYRAMMRDGVLCSNVDAETALDLLHGYYDIRNERNQVNHANSGSTTDIATLEKMINSYLQRLERY
ncbi:MAG: hypothetical protein IJU71_06980, partial [Selenomonadaceae bacterium]|nr:hypothetical protein [Selenomonadaceae bacterium]